MAELLKKSINQKIAVTVFGLAVTLPLVWLNVLSFARNWRFPAILPPEMSWRAWSYLFAATSEISTALLNSLLIALVVTILAICLALPAARGIALYDFKGKNVVMFALLLPILSPAIATAIGGHALFLRYGLTDSYLGVILVHLIPTVPYCVLTLTGSFLRFDVNLEAQARTLGASNRQVLFFVTMPSIAPGIVVSAVFAFLISWSQYLTTWLIGGGKIVTLPLVLIGFQRSSDEAVTSALTLVFLIPTIIFVAFTARFWRDV